jgi:hypothetical protein
MSGKSKKEKKREKIDEKDDSNFCAPYRKPHYEEYQIPPYTHEHLRALLLEYLAQQILEPPLHHITIYNKVKTFYQNFQNTDIYMKDLDLPDTLKEL